MRALGEWPCCRRRDLLTVPLASSEPLWQMSLEEADQAVVEAEMERLALETCWLDEVGIGEEHLHTTRSEELDLRIDHRLRKKALEDTLRQLEELEMEDREEMCVCSRRAMPLSFALSNYRLIICLCFPARRSWKARMHKEVESKTNQLAEQRRERERRQMLLQESYERNAKTREEEIRRRRLEQVREGGGVVSLAMSRAAYFFGRRLCNAIFLAGART